HHLAEQPLLLVRRQRVPGLGPPSLPQLVDRLRHVALPGRDAPPPACSRPGSPPARPPRGLSFSKRVERPYSPRAGLRSLRPSRDRPPRGATARRAGGRPSRGGRVGRNALARLSVGP